MTLRGRLATAFLAVVLGPVLLGSLFVGMTVATVHRDRSVERLDHAATTVHTSVGAMCRQLQATADALAATPEEGRSAAASRMVDRGLLSEVTDAADPQWRDCSGVGGGGVEALTATADDVVAVQRVDADFVARLAASSGVDVVLLAHDGSNARVVHTTLTGSGDIGTGRLQAVTQQDGLGASRRVPAGPGQPLPLLVSVPDGQPVGLFVLLASSVVVAAGAAVAVARWLARSTTQPLADLAVAAGRVADGDLDTRVPVMRDDEIGQLSSTFNRMTRELQTYVQALTTSRDQLRGHLAILGDTLSSTHDLHRILQVLLQTALAATGARAGAVLLLDPTDKRLVARCAEGLGGRWDVPEAELPTLRVPVGEGVLGAVAATGQPRRGICGLGTTWQPGESGAGERGAREQNAGEVKAAERRAAERGAGERGAGERATGERETGGRGSDQRGADERGAGKTTLGEVGPGEVVPGEVGPGEVGPGEVGPGEVGPGEPPCTTYVAVPICAPADEVGVSQTLGVLALYDRLGGDQFDDSDMSALRTFAGQAGVAVHNVRVHEEAQRLSLTDPLTGLWNYRYLRESIRREVERANRFGRMLSVLVLDLDHFKDVNDTYGHAAGDTVLQEFARRLRVGLREVDLAFRQGGEEFVVLLPETDAYGGAIVAERLGAALRDAPIAVDTRRVDPATGSPADRITVTVSVGVAVYPEHGVTAQQVLDAADDALYAAKHAGRDTYRLAEMVSPVVPEGHFGQARSTPGGPKPPRQGRGR